MRSPQFFQSSGIELVVANALSVVYQIAVFFDDVSFDLFAIFVKHFFAFESISLLAVVKVKIAVAVLTGALLAI